MISHMYKNAMLLTCCIFLATILFGENNLDLIRSLSTNVALNKTAAQSSTKNGGVASRAVDGNINGSFYHPDQSVSSTSYEEEAWWEVDLGGVYDLSEINLWNQTGGNSTEDYYVLVSNFPFPSTDLTMCLNDSNVSNYYNSGTMGTPSNIVLSGTGRYIRVQGKDWGFVTLAEVAVMGDVNAGGTAVTITAPVDVNDEFTLNIEFDKTITGLTLDDFSVLNGGITNLAGSQQTYSATIVPDGNPITISLSEGTVLDENGNLNLASNELIINYNPGGGVTTNLALNKTASQSSTKNGGVASRAVDGNTNGSFYHPDESVSSTSYGDQGWWEVDLGGVYTIETIEAWNQTGGNSTSNYYVLVSDNPFPSNDLTTLLNDPEIAAFQNAGTMDSPSIVDVNRTGQYVRIQSEDWGFVTMAEVKVMGQESAAGPSANYRVYTRLKKELDGSYVRTIDQKLYFQHIEGYAIVSGENSALKYKIYDWKKELMQSGSLQNDYGVNWFVLSPKAQLPEDYYILEVNDVNKEETYYLRFKYISN